MLRPRAASFHHKQGKTWRYGIKSRSQVGFLRQPLAGLRQLLFLGDVTQVRLRIGYQPVPGRRRYMVISGPLKVAAQVCEYAAKAWS